MDVFEGLETIPQPFGRSTVAIGTFDGVHAGHRALVRTAVADARIHSRPALVFTFDRHPAELLAPERAPAYLTTPAQRNRLLAELGADALIVARFDRTLSELGPDDFVQQILKNKLGAAAIVEGRDFAFARNRTGNLAYLLGVQERFGFEVHALDPVEIDGVPVSSTRIRERLRDGDIAGAEAMLQHPFWLAGTVVRDQQLARTLGYPTANLALTVRQAVPADGIYAVRAALADGRTFGGACSIGERPTVEGAGRSIETFLFDFDEDIYGRGMELRFVQRLRLEAKFDSLDALKAQMAQDVEQAKIILKDK